MFLKKPRIAICGLNPHCENFFGISEEKKIIEPAKKYLILFLMFLGTKSLRLNNDLCSIIIDGSSPNMLSINNPLASKAVDGIATFIPGK